MKLSIFALIFISSFLLASCSTVPSTEPAKTADINALTLEEKVGLLFVIRPESIDNRFSLEEVHTAFDKGTTEVTSQMKKTYAEYPAGGFTLFARNITSPEQLKEFTKNLHSLGVLHPLLFIDEEGGKVARLANHSKFNLPKYENMLSLGNTNNPDTAFQAGVTIGKYLKEYGFDVNFAPVADVNTNPENPIIGSRAFSSDPQIAATMDIAFLQGMSKAGVSGCLKHFPGHGDTKTDTHKGYAETTKNWEELLNCELITFKSGIQNNVPFIMTAHITAPNIDSTKVPSTMSYTILTEKLRNEMNYQGLIISDAMEMGAIAKAYSPETASIKAIQAGIDIVLIPYDYKTAYTSVLNAVKNGTITEQRIDQSVERILKFKQTNCTKKH